MRNHFGLTVKDVRKLHTCCICGQLGIYQPEHPELAIPILVCIHSTETEPLTVPRKQRSFCHPRCYVESMSVEKLLSLHAEELGCIRLGDLPMKTIQRITQELTRRRKGTGNRA